MTAVRCPSCGHEGNVPGAFVGKSVRCPKCNVKIKLAGRKQLLWIALAVAVLVAVGAASYFAFRHFFRDQAAAPVPADALVLADANAGDSEAGKKSVDELLAKLADLRKQQEARQRQEEDRLTLEQERQRQKNEERERQGILMLLEQERILVEKKHPQLAATLEEIDKFPDKFYGKILTVDRVVVKGTAIDRHKDLGRYTLGATTERNHYYSRVPISGLLLSTTDKLAADLQGKIGTAEPFPRVKLYCEIRKWERRVNDDVKTGPEVCIYRVEVYDAVGRLAAAMGD